jgi:hypothetical protein
MKISSKKNPIIVSLLCLVSLASCGASGNSEAPSSSVNPFPYSLDYVTTHLTGDFYFKYQKTTSESNSLVTDFSLLFSRVGDDYFAQSEDNQFLYVKNGDTYYRYDGKEGTTLVASTTNPTYSLAEISDELAFYYKRDMARYVADMVSPAKTGTASIMETSCDIYSIIDSGDTYTYWINPVNGVCYKTSIDDGKGSVASSVVTTIKTSDIALPTHA